MGGFKGRGIVGAVPSDGHYLVVGLEGFHQTLLVERTGAGDNFQVPYAAAQFLVGELFELRTCNDVAVSVAVGPESDLAADFAGCAWSVAGYDLDGDSGLGGLCHSLRDVGADRVGNGHESQERDTGS